MSLTGIQISDKSLFVSGAMLYYTRSSPIPINTRKKYLTILLSLTCLHKIPGRNNNIINGKITKENPSTDVALGIRRGLKAHPNGFPI